MLSSGYFHTFEQNCFSGTPDGSLNLLYVLSIILVFVAYPWWLRTFHPRALGVDKGGYVDQALGAKYINYDWLSNELTI